MSGSCATCATPVGSRDRACPSCGAAVLREQEPTVVPGRRVLIPGGTDGPVATPAGTAAPSAPRPFGQTAATPLRPRRTDSGPTACGTITGEVTEAEVAAVGRPQRLWAAAGAGLAIAAVVALLILGGEHRRAGLTFLLPTFLVTAVLAAAPLLIPRSRTHSTVLRFAVTAVSGSVTLCELLGAPTAAPPRKGEMVEVFGRGTPLRVGEVVRGEERFRGRAPAVFLIVRGAPIVALALSVVCAAIACALVATA